MNDNSSARIVKGLRAWIGSAAPGAQLPSTRALVATYAASPVTVQHALRELAAQGLVETRPGVGTFVRAVRAPRRVDHGWQTAALRAPRLATPALSIALRSVPNEMLALHDGYPDRELLPQRLVRAALARAARSDHAVSRPPVAGLPDLQQWFAQELGHAMPAHLSAPAPSDVIVLPGSQSGLSAVFRALVPRGRPLLLESPTYWGAINAAAQAGVEVVPVPSGPQGPDPDELERAFTETGARLFYAQPTYANPTGAQWTREASEHVLSVVRRHGAFVLEDDWAHDFGIDSEPHPLAAMDDEGHVIYLRSLTKSVSPAIRVAALVARGPARARILDDSVAGSMYVSGVLQAAALDVITQPGWHTHLRQMRRALHTRRDLLLDALREHVPQAHVAQVPAGGLNLWAQLPDSTEIERLARECEALGLMIAPGTDWFPAEPSGPFVRLTYSGPRPSAFGEAARLLGVALDAHPGQRST